MQKRKYYPKKLFVRDTHPELPLDPDVVQPGVYKWPVHFQMPLQLTVFVGGCMGALARYGLIQIMPTLKDALPVATLFVNLLGAFLLGVLLEALARRGEDKGLRRLVRLGLGTGFIGAFTTYSTFAVEIDLLIGNGKSEVAIFYAAVSVLGGIVLSALGIQIAAKHHKRLMQGKA